METPAVSGAFDAVARLCAGPFEYRVHLVSKAGPKIAALTRECLAHVRCFERTGLSPANVWFVRKRPEKVGICSELGVTRFVDDRLDVLEHLRGVSHRYLFIGGLGRHEAPAAVSARIRVSRDWPDLARTIEMPLRFSGSDSTR